MAEKIYWHIGLPKTGTTYLQQILWTNRDELRRQGLTLCAANHRHSLWAALDLMERPKLSRRHRDAPGSWERLCAELDAVPGTALVSHEFFCGADDDQIERAAQRLRPAEIHLVITARDAAGMLAAGWQESVKNGGVLTLREMAERQGHSEFSWWTWDLEQVLRRWSQSIPADRIHVLPMPGRDEAPDQHWQNFAATLGYPLDVEQPERPVNQSLGVVQIQALRLINQHLEGFTKPVDRGTWIRGYLAEDHLARQGSARLRLDDDVLADCRARAERAVDVIGELGVDVVGSLERLRVPADVPGGRLLSSVDSDEVAECTARLVASMMHDVRHLTDEQHNEVAKAAVAHGPAGRVRRWLSTRRALVYPQALMTNTTTR